MSHDDGAEPPSKVLFKNHQWSVTDYGVEAVRPEWPYYPFNKERLLETTTRGDDELYDWPIHMAEKSWVDIEAFIETFKIALKLHAASLRGKVDEEMLEKSLAYARREAARR